MRRKLFCELSPACYRISVKKEILKRKVKDRISQQVLAQEKREELYPHIVKSHASLLLRHLHGVDMRLQENKVHNIQLACEKLSGVVIQPGETFSYWTLLGPTGQAQGYKEGLVIGPSGFSSGYGGGLCQMANLIHWLVLNSPLTVTELHHHSDALFPDDRRRVPFGTGTSVVYNYLDYRFKNTTDQPVQILVWIDDGYLCGELRSPEPYPWTYRLVEENHHFAREGDKYYRISQVYRTRRDRNTRQLLSRECILHNHSLVMYDPALIPPEEICEEQDD